MGGWLSRSKKLNKSQSTLDYTSRDSTLSRRRAKYHSNSVCEIELKNFRLIEEDIGQATISSKRCSSADSRPANITMAGLKAIERDEMRRKLEEGLVRNTKKPRLTSNQILTNSKNNIKSSVPSDALEHAQSLPEDSRRPNEVGLRALERDEKMRREKEMQARRIYKEKYDRITRFKSTRT